MRKLSKIIAGLGLVLFATQSFAIDVHVQSSSSGIFALGYTVDGSKHGGLGKTYNGNGMPAGTYTFGLRSHGKDVGCVTKDGKKDIKINSNTMATYDFNGTTCTVSLAPM
jgi:hypothetical protein